LYHSTSGRLNLSGNNTMKHTLALLISLLLEERICSYPDGVQSKDGNIYVVYDQGRPGGQILMAVFTEEDVAAGKPISGACRLQVPVKQTGAQLLKK